MTASTEHWDEIAAYKELQGWGLIPVHGDFFPAVHYPPITKYAPLDPSEALAGFEKPADGRIDIYVHIPFCRRRCVFCHYPSKYRARPEEKDRYLTALEKEMDIFLRRMQMDQIRPRSILIGGGTPTDLTPEQLEHFLKYFTKRTVITPSVQFNYDVDPSTLIGEDGIKRLQIMRDYGVNRLTIGVQSLNEDILKIMNRSHSVAEAVESVHNCLEMGFKVNIEFIFGFPGQTLDNWRENVRHAVSLGVDEIQLYRLKYEPYGDQVGTITTTREHYGAKLVSVEDTLRMKRIAIDLLAEHGYTENLRRVFTRTRKDISLYAYNQCCRLIDQIGFGQTAFGSLHDRFLLNTFSFDKYYDAIEQGVLPVDRGIIRSLDEQMRWAIILPLKNYYLPKSLFRRITGRALEETPFHGKLQTLIQLGLVEEDTANYTLTKKGAFFADEVVETFYGRSYIPFPEADYLPGPLNPYQQLPDKTLCPA